MKKFVKRLTPSSPVEWVRLMMVTLSGVEFVLQLRDALRDEPAVRAKRR